MSIEWKPAIRTDSAGTEAFVDHNYNVYLGDELVAVLGNEGSWVECLIADAAPKKVALRACQAPEQVGNNSWTPFRKLRKVGDWWAFGLKRPAMNAGADINFYGRRREQRWPVDAQVEGNLVVIDFSRAMAEVDKCDP